MFVDYILSTFDYTGTLAFAISGALAAARKKFDLFGGVFLGFVTAIGGGTLRDMMLNIPVAWLHDIWYFYIVLFGVIITFLFRKHMSPDAIRITGGKDTYGDTAAYLKSILREGDHVLFKASRSMALETMVEALTAN